MTGKFLRGVSGAALLALSMTAAAADPLAVPANSGPLKVNPDPYSIDLDVPGLGWLIGKTYVSGVASAMVMGQTAANQNPGDKDFVADMTNGQVILQKTDGWFQWYVQAGAYSLPTLAVPYARASVATPATYDTVPVAYVKLVLDDSLNIQAGKLFTLVGYELAFSFQNMNVTRGMLWNQEPVVSRGVQVNYATGPLSISVSLTDAFYFNRPSWITGLVAYSFNGGSDILSFVGGGNLSQESYASAQQNGSIFNLIYTHISGNWTISPYVQFANVPTNNFIGITKGATEIGGALLASYHFNDNWSLAGRFEYMGTAGTPSSANLFLGPSSDAVSFTITPTWQWKRLFIRPELSYVSASNVTPGMGMGPSGTDKDQFRGLVEFGVLL